MKTIQNPILQKAMSADALYAKDLEKAKLVREARLKACLIPLDSDAFPIVFSPANLIHYTRFALSVPFSKEANCFTKLRLIPRDGITEEQLMAKGADGFQVGKYRPLNATENAGTLIYLYPEYDWAAVRNDPTMLRIWYEGEFDTVAGINAFNRPILGLQGKDNWSRGSILDTGLAEPETAHLIIREFDTKATTRRKVNQSTQTLKTTLKSLGCIVNIADLSQLQDTAGKVSLDSLIAGTDDYEALWHRIISVEMQYLSYTDKIPFPELVFPPTSLKVSKNEGISIKSTLETVAVLLDMYGISIRRNVINLKHHIIENTQVSDDCDNIGFLATRVESLLKLNDIMYDSVVNKLDLISQKPAYNPVKDWLMENYTILNHQKGAIDRVANSFVVSKPEQRTLFNKCFRLWLIQACAAGDFGEQTPNTQAIRKYEYVLIFLGEQGAKKTSLFRQLVPKVLHDYFKDGLSLNTKDKDSMLNILSYWIVELGEIDTTIRASAISELKAYLSQLWNDIRLSYGRSAIKIARHTAHCGTVNEANFLHDNTGNRRYWPFEVEEMDTLQLLDDDVVAMWAEAWHEYISGAAWWLPRDEELDMRAITDQHTIQSDIVLLVHGFLAGYTKESYAERLAHDKACAQTLKELDTALELSMKAVKDVSTYKPDGAISELSRAYNDCLTAKRLFEAENIPIETPTPEQIVAGKGWELGQWITSKELLIIAGHNADALDAGRCTKGYCRPLDAYLNKEKYQNRIVNKETLWSIKLYGFYGLLKGKTGRPKPGSKIAVKA